jgi:DeoR/GlpR family transcriptional regulator of sugar metabolism
MTARERRHQIGYLLQERPVSVEELAAQFDVSLSTIRRDLQLLAEQGGIARTYGGAQTASHTERSLHERESIATKQKAAIGKLASTFVQPDSVVILDAGTTVGALANRLVHSEGITVVTNGLTTIRALEHSEGVELIAVGGRVRHVSSGMVGPFAELVMSGITADAAFLSADGVVAGRGLSEESSEQASLKRKMVENAHSVYILADSTKLGLDSSHWWTALDKPWSLITDDEATEQQLQPFRALGSVQVHVAPVGS